MTLGKSPALQVNTHDSQSGSELPEGWAYPKVGEMLAVNYGKGLKKAKRMPGPVPVYGSNGVVGTHSIPLTHGPTIILGRKGTVGAVHFSKTPCWPIDTTYFIDEFNGLAPRYLVYALRRLNLSQLDTSTAIPGLNRDELYKQYVALSPVAEQKRIVAKVEQLLARVNAARERLAKVSEILKRFRQSVLAAAFTGRLTNNDVSASRKSDVADQFVSELWKVRKTESLRIVGESGEEKVSKTKTKHSEVEPGDIDLLQKIPSDWQWTSLSTCTDVADGTHDSPKYHERGVPLITSKNLTPTGIDFGNVKLISLDDHDQISLASG